jgi:hypothetical protein
MSKSPVITSVNAVKVFSEHGIGYKNDGKGNCVINYGTQAAEFTWSVKNRLPGRGPARLLLQSVPSFAAAYPFKGKFVKKGTPTLFDTVEYWTKYSVERLDAIIEAVTQARAAVVHRDEAEDIEKLKALIKKHAFTNAEIQNALAELKTKPS